MSFDMWLNFGKNHTNLFSHETLVFRTACSGHDSLDVLGTNAALGFILIQHNGSYGVLARD